MYSRKTPQVDVNSLSQELNGKVSVSDIGQDDDGNLTVLVRWYGFPEDEPTELTIAQMLDGGHLMLDKYLEEHKSHRRPDLYKAFKQKVQAYQMKLKDTRVISVDEHSTNEGYWDRTLDDFRPLRYRHTENPPMCFSDSFPIWKTCYFRVMNFRLRLLLNECLFLVFTDLYQRLNQ